jgi:hypothetical protein
MMGSKELIEKIRGDVADTKEKGFSSIPVENLFAYLDELEKNSDHSANQLTSQQLEEFKADLAVWQAGRTELFKSVVLAAQNALKSAILINGAAAVALLAFIGNVWKAGGSPLLIAIAGALYWFVIGVLLDAVSTAFFYFTQWSCAMSDKDRDKFFKAGVTFHAPGSFACTGVLRNLLLRNAPGLLCISQVKARDLDGCPKGHFNAGRFLFDSLADFQMERRFMP